MTFMQTLDHVKEIHLDITNAENTVDMSLVPKPQETGTEACMEMTKYTSIATVFA